MSFDDQSDVDLIEDLLFAADIYIDCCESNSYYNEKYDQIKIMDEIIKEIKKRAKNERKKP